ncbi:MAG: hypothetical protein V4722_04370 [Bacteroidota bacterium]
MNGTVTYRNRKLPIFWGGENAEHIADNFVHRNNTHPYLHVAIQRMLQKSKNSIVKRGSVIAWCTAGDGRKTCVVFVIKGNLAVIKTCYLHGWT